MSYRAVMALDTLEWGVVPGYVVSDNLAVVGADGTHGVVWRVLNALDGLAFAVRACSEYVELRVKDLELAVDEADSDVLTVAGHGYGVGGTLKLDIYLLLACGHVPDGKHSVSADGDHLSVEGVDCEAPQLTIEMSSHADSGRRSALSFDDLTTTGADEDSVLGTDADTSWHGVH